MTLAGASQMTLSDFLLARVREDEEAAQAAHVTTALPPVWDIGLMFGPVGPANVHIARHDPARVLAECEAKRRIVGRLAAIERAAATSGATTSYAEGYDHGILDAARFLALPYVDHPDYRQEWAPETVTA